MIIAVKEYALFVFFKNQEPCITNKIAYGVATNKEVEENYKKMLEEEELKE